MGAHPRQGRLEGHTQLDVDHALSLVHLRPVMVKGLAELVVQPPAGSESLTVQHGRQRDLCERQSLREGVARQCAGGIAVDVEHADPGRTDLQGEREDRSDTLLMSG